VPDASRPTQPMLPFRPPLPAHPPGPAEGDANRAAHLAKGDRRPPGSIWRANPREQGLLGLTDAIGWFGSQGWSISLPLIDSQPYDLVVDDGHRLQRVQVKTTTYRSRYGVFVVSLATRGGNQSFHTSKAFDATSCELLYVLTDAGERYLIPTTAVRSAITLSLGRRHDEHRLRA
jgi:hypothetical protein